MATTNDMQKHREASLRVTESGPPTRTANPFFGVGPITNMTVDEVDRRLTRFEFEAGLENNYQQNKDMMLPKDVD